LPIHDIGVSNPETPVPHPRAYTRRVFFQRSATALMMAPLLGNEVIAEGRRTFVPGDFISVQEGRLPIILSAPHGGVLPIPDVPARGGDGIKKGGAGFFTGRDENTELLAAAIARALESRLGKKPYFVIARFHRKYIDPNRPPEIAVEHPRAREVYDLYRGTLAKFCDAVQTRFGSGLLIDVHGQASARDTVFRGTHNGATDAKLVKLFGEKVHAGPQSLAGMVSARGINMKPTDTSAETSGFTGGHIVQTYGRHEGIGAVQFEFGMDFREKGAINATAEKVADGIADFAKLYLLGKLEPKR
jgi:N-formylglutamate amidohydrolase